jgi:hypothetical protein
MYGDQAMQAAADITLANYNKIQAMAQYAGASAAQTAFCWVQKTIGVGFRVMAVKFDLFFTAEPIFAPGAALISLTGADYMPYTQALVLYWTRDPGSGAYTGAAVALAVELRSTPGFVLKNHTTSSADATVPTVAHHLTFTGPAIAPPAAAAGGPKGTGMTP